MAHEQPHIHHNISMRLKKYFILAISMNIIYALLELISGFFYGSMSLISDAGHNFVDVFSLTLALAGLFISGIKPNKKFTFGYKKSTILAAVINSIILVIAVILILKESIYRIFDPVELNGTSMIIIAGIGILINGLTGLLFYKDHHRDINVKAAFMHLIADALVSLGVVIAGFIVLNTGWTIIDPLFSIIIALVIFFMTISILKNSIKMALDGVPQGIDSEKISERIAHIEGIKGIHHIHIWSLGSNESAFTAHIELSEKIDSVNLVLIKSQIRSVLEENQIHHSTIEFEVPDEKCQNHCN
ncbi:MAG: cation diffusion facilitator family transporter [Deltaproteobacteria bacterium]